MSFFKRLFGSSSKNDSTSTNPSENTNDLSIQEERVAIAIPPTYKEIKEEEFKNEQMAFYDGDKLLYNKLNLLFKEKVSLIDFSKFKDEFRPAPTNKNGGIDFNNKYVTDLLRSTGKEFIKQIGKKLITGDFNLTKIPFPIKIMTSKTFLQATSLSLFQFPYFMNLAVNQSPLEKMRLVIVAVFSGFHSSCFFMKPLNPILGETYTCCYEDGSRLYLEQTSHHPPVTNFEVYGPNGNYYMYGTTAYKTSVALNLALNLYNKGKRYIIFPDGTKIFFDYCKVSSSFFKV